MVKLSHECMLTSLQVCQGSDLMQCDKMMVGRLHSSLTVCLLQLVTYGDTREEALTTMAKALDNYCIKGN